MKNCVHCGELLPEEANLCPACGKQQSKPEAAGTLRPWKRKTLTVVLAFIAIIALLAFTRFYHVPRTYLSEGPEVFYTDRDGDYRIILTWTYKTRTEG
nr:zinc ribbon domain-containing protein [Oscillospiraceae bacterium]